MQKLDSDSKLSKFLLGKTNKQDEVILSVLRVMKNQHAEFCL